MSNILNRKEYSQLNQKYIEQYLEDNGESYQQFSQIIDEEINKINSYEKLMQIKRSIDSLIEILYSQASFDDIDIELETTKCTQAKSESQKRVQEKKRKVIENITHYIAAQQQEARNSLDFNSHNKTQEVDVDISEIKEKLKSPIKEILFAVLASRMDPKQRAGETESSNAKHAGRYGRMENGSGSNIFSSLLKLMLNIILNVNVDTSLNMPFSTKIKAESQNKKTHGASI